jgi:hypothetical protein
MLFRQGSRSIKDGVFDKEMADLWLMCCWCRDLCYQKSARSFDSNASSNATIATQGVEVERTRLRHRE